MKVLFITVKTLTMLPEIDREAPILKVRIDKGTTRDIYRDMIKRQSKVKVLPNQAQSNFGRFLVCAR